MVDATMNTDDGHVYEPHIGASRQYMRDIILGVNDGLVSTFLLVSGVVGGGLSSTDVLLTGVAGALAGMISMAIGEYLATKSQEEVFDAELALEAEAALALAFRVAQSFDNAAQNPAEAAFARIATPIAKYWICKRAPDLVYEAMEAHGGAGYVEEHPLPRMFRQSPLNAIWEGSGNVIALDVLRALSRDAAAREALDAELAPLAGLHPAVDARLRALREMMAGGLSEARARRFTELSATLLTAAALQRAGLDPALEAYLGRRIAENATTLGAGEATIDTEWLVSRARLRS